MKLHHGIAPEVSGAQHGREVVEACASAGCHYLDTAGEQDWLIDCDENYGATMAAKDLLLSPGIAQMYTTGEIAACLCLETPGLDTAPPPAPRNIPGLLAFAWAANRRHASAPTTSAGPYGSLLSRTATAPAGVPATSTQLPALGLWRLFRHTVRDMSGVLATAIPHLLGALGLDPGSRVLVSSTFTARTAAGRAIYDMHGRVLSPRPGIPVPAATHITWHARQVFKGDPLAA